MDIIIQSSGFIAGESLENFIRERINKFDKEAKAIRADVTLHTGTDSRPDKYCCEIRLEVPGNDHFVKKCGDTFEKAIVEAVDTIHHQMRKTKEKQIARNQGSLK